jgi:hypothetical protein
MKRIAATEQSTTGSEAAWNPCVPMQATCMGSHSPARWSQANAEGSTVADKGQSAADPARGSGSHDLVQFELNGPGRLRAPASPAGTHQDQRREGGRSLLRAKEMRKIRERARDFAELEAGFSMQSYRCCKFEQVELTRTASTILTMVNAVLLKGSAPRPCVTFQSRSLTHSRVCRTEAIAGIWKHIVRCVFLVFKASFRSLG